MIDFNLDDINLHLMKCIRREPAGECEGLLI